MLRNLVVIMTAALALGLGACASSNVRSTGAAAVSPSEAGTIALAPGAGILGDAVLLELSTYGFRVIEAEATERLMGRLGLDEFDMTTASGLSELARNGVDTVLIVRSAGGYDDNIQSATARLVSTSDGSLLSGATWQNGFAGQQGSIADRMMRRGLNQAAVELADALANP
ncbi:MAG: hypothetical protein GC187_08375 [Alphaproteobacteria bacterium]|nr:hypothetical protein [Alphaproteobacteria bacterium]